MKVLETLDYAAWASMVADSPDGSVYATAEYLDAFCGAAGGHFRILGAWSGERLVGGIPLYERSSRIGTFVGPRLLLYYLGPVLRRSNSTYPSQQTALTLEILGALADGLSDLNYAKITLKGRHTLSDVRPFLGRGWKSHPSYTYVVSLHDLSGQWNRVEQNLRRLVDRCTRENLTITEDDDFGSFLKLHEQTMAHHGAEPYLPEDRFGRWFRALHQLGLCRLFQARLPDGKPIAAQIVLLGAHPISHTVCAATDPAHRRLGASTFLRWRVFEWLAVQGKAGNDLTDAALNPVTHFKSQFGGELVTNFVLERRGNVLWRMSVAAESGYRALRRKGGNLLRSTLARVPR